MTTSNHFHGIGHDHTHSFSGMPVYTDPIIKPGTMYGIGGAIYGRPNDIDRMLHEYFTKTQLGQDQPTPAKAPMNTIDKIKQERREKREREELELKFAGWDEIIGLPDDGDVVTFAWTPGDKAYRYAAIWTDKKWWLTGQTTCGMAMEDFIAWLIDKDIKPEDMVFVEPLT